MNSLHGGSSTGAMQSATVLGLFHPCYKEPLLRDDYSVAKKKDIEYFHWIALKGSFTQISSAILTSYFVFVSWQSGSNCACWCPVPEWYDRLVNCKDGLCMVTWLRSFNDLKINAQNFKRGVFFLSTLDHGNALQMPISSETTSGCFCGCSPVFFLLHICNAKRILMVEERPHLADSGDPSLLFRSFIV